MDRDYLIHYGVLGMKWGVRKDGKPQGYQGSGKGRRSGSADHIRSKVNERREEAEARREVKRDVVDAKKNRRTLSDREIEQRINRINKEARLREVTEQEYEPVKSFFKKTAKRAVNTVVPALATAAMLVFMPDLLNVLNNSVVKLKDILPMPEIVKNTLNKVSETSASRIDQLVSTTRNQAKR